MAGQSTNVDQLFAAAVEGYGLAVEKNDTAALDRAKQTAAQIAELTGKRVADIRAEVVASYWGGEPQW